MASLDSIEGIGAVYMAKLKEAGISSVESLLETCATPKGRADVEAKTGIGHELILDWTNQADLFRVGGIGEEYAQLLEVAGVDTVAELARRNPENLYQALVEKNAEKNLVRRLPTQKQVADWVANAGSLPRIVQY